MNSTRNHYYQKGSLEHNIKDAKSADNKSKIKGKIKIKNLKKERLNNYKESLLEKEDKECTFFPKLNDNYNNRHINRIKKINGIKIVNNNKDNNDENNFDTIYNRSKKWKNNISKKNEFINKINDKEEQKYSFIPNINKSKNINLIFKDNNYSNYWLKHNKSYINRRLKFINNNIDNLNNTNPFNSYLSNLKERNGYSSNINGNKANNTLDSEQKTEAKININYIKKLLHEELQNTKSEDEDEIN